MTTIPPVTPDPAADTPERTAETPNQAMEASAGNPAPIEMALPPSAGALPQETPTQNEEATPAPPPKQGVPMVWIPATLCVGLLIAAVYLGGRILNAHAHSAKPAASPHAVEQAHLPPSPPAPEPPPVTTPAPAPPQATPPEAAASEVTKAPAPLQLSEQTPALSPDEPLPTITPKPGERYIQVGALDVKLTRRYIPQLREAKLDPHIAEGPTPDLLRILLGPFHNHDALTAAQRQLDSAGIPNFVREY
jgi:hypothetical protein